MEGPRLGPGGEDITWPDQVAPRGRKASSTRNIKPQTSNLSFGVLLSLSCLGGVMPCCFVCAGWCYVLLPVVAGWSLLGLVPCCCFLLACVVAGAPAWARGLLPCCVLWFVVVPRTPVLCPVFRGPVLLCGAVLWRPAVLFLCLWCWFVSFSCVCSSVLRCASSCSVPVWSALLLVPHAVVWRSVLWCLPWRFVVWWCCSGVSWCLAVPCCVLWCCVALWCRGAGLCSVFSFAAGVPISSKNYFPVFEN